MPAVIGPGLGRALAGCPESAPGRGRGASAPQREYATGVFKGRREERRAWLQSCTQRRRGLSRRPVSAAFYTAVSCRSPAAGGKRLQRSLKVGFWFPRAQEEPRTWETNELRGPRNQNAKKKDPDFLFISFFLSLTRNFGCLGCQYLFFLALPINCK